jgi:hypothetical protein
MLHILLCQVLWLFSFRYFPGKFVTTASMVSRLRVFARLPYHARNTYVHAFLLYSVFVVGRIM